MRKIKLTKGKFTTVDNEDFEKLSQYNWQVNSNGYAVRQDWNKMDKRSKTIRMHRSIMDCPAGLVVDHINHDVLDNRRENLRVCTIKQNCMNQKPRERSSKYKGVSWGARDKRWCAHIRVDYKGINLGSFKREEDAAIAYDKAAARYQGEFAYQNITKQKER